MNITKRAFGLILGGAMLAGGVGGAALAVQGHMDNALKDLQYAHTELMAAAADKGGHRLNAMKLVDQATAEVKAGIAAGS